MSETPALGCDFVGQDFGASYPDSVCIDATKGQAMITPDTLRQLADAHTCSTIEGVFLEGCTGAMRHGLRPEERCLQCRTAVLLREAADTLDAHEQELAETREALRSTMREVDSERIRRVAAQEAITKTGGYVDQLEAAEAALTEARQQRDAALSAVGALECAVGECQHHVAEARQAREAVEAMAEQHRRLCLAEDATEAAVWPCGCRAQITDSHGSRKLIGESCDLHDELLERLAALTAENEEAQRVAAFARLFQQAARDESLSDLEARNVARFISLSPITEREIARGRELAEKYGWEPIARIPCVTCGHLSDLHGVTGDGRGYCSGLNCVCHAYQARAALASPQEPQQ